MLYSYISTFGELAISNRFRDDVWITCVASRDRRCRAEEEFRTERLFGRLEFYETVSDGF